MKPPQAITQDNVRIPNATCIQTSENRASTHPDQKYIDALLNNDVVLLEELYQKFSGKIKLVVLQNNGTLNDAAEIFMEALLAIYRKAKTEHFILPCSLDRLLYFVCKNKWMHEVGKRK